MNWEKIVETIAGLDVSPLAKEEAANLVEGWVREFWAVDSQLWILAPEVGWCVELAPKTYAIGVIDLLAIDDGGVFGNEWKTTKEPSRYWTETKWLEGIKTGPQIAIYGLALRDGIFYDSNGPFVIPTERPETVRIRVRAAVKTAVPAFWPRDAAEGWQKFSDADMDKVRDALLNKAEQIRASMRTGRLPWQLMGQQCESFGRKCEFWDECLAGQFVKMANVGFDVNNPAAKLVLSHLPAAVLADPETVILSASSYQSFSRCMDLGRREAAAGNREQSLALQTGETFHAALACLYQQMMEEQRTYQQMAEEQKEVIK